MEDNQKQIFASIRCKRLNNVSMLVAAEKHARREDESCRNRLSEGRFMFKERTKDNLVWSPSGGDPMAIYAEFKERKKASSASERKGSALGLHLLAIVSPELIKESGDLHDPDNPANKKIFEQARKWAESEFGEGSLIHARMDLDEKGGGVVDLVVVPVHQQTIRGKTKNIISTRKALSDVSERWGQTKSFSALQDSFADYAKRNIDQRIERGILKDVSGALHHEPAVLRDRDDELSKREESLLKQESDIHEREENLLKQETSIREKERSTAKHERILSERASSLARENLNFEKNRLFLGQVWDVLSGEVRRIYKHVTDAKKELKEVQAKGGFYAELFRVTLGKNARRDAKHAYDKGKEDGKSEQVAFFEKKIDTLNDTIRRKDEEIKRQKQNVLNEQNMRRGLHKLTEEEHSAVLNYRMNKRCNASNSPNRSKDHTLGM